MNEEIKNTKVKLQMFITIAVAVEFFDFHKQTVQAVYCYSPVPTIE